MCCQICPSLYLNPHMRNNRNKSPPGRVRPPLPAPTSCSHPSRAAVATTNWVKIIHPTLGDLPASDQKTTLHRPSPVTLEMLLLQAVVLAADRPHVCPSWDWPSAAPPSPPRPPWKPMSAQVEAKERTRQRGMLGASPDKTRSDRSHRSPSAHLFIPSFHPGPPHSAVWAAGLFPQPPGEKQIPEGGGATRPVSASVCSRKEMGRLYQTHLCTHERRTDRAASSVGGFSLREVRNTSPKAEFCCFTQPK